MLSTPLRTAPAVARRQWGVLLVLALVLVSAGRPAAASAGAEPADVRHARCLWQAMTTATGRVRYPDGRRRTLEVRIADEPREWAQGAQHIPTAAVRATPIWFRFEREAVRHWHMRNVRTALDIAFMDGNGRVLAVQRMTPGETGYASSVPIRAALELVAGEARRLGIVPGTRLSLASSAGRSSAETDRDSLDKCGGQSSRAGALGIRGGPTSPQQQPAVKQRQRPDRFSFPRRAGRGSGATGHCSTQPLAHSP